MIKIVNYLCLCLVLLSNVCCAQKTQPKSIPQNSETSAFLFIPDRSDMTDEERCAAFKELNCDCWDPKSNSCKECDVVSELHTCEPTVTLSEFKFFLVNPPKGQNCLPDGTCTMPILASIVPFVNTKLNNKTILQQERKIKKTTIYLNVLKPKSNGVFTFQLGKSQKTYQISYKNGLFDISTLKLAKQ
jgi:hypothetical protein